MIAEDFKNMTIEQKAALFGCSADQIKKQYRSNLIGLEQMRDKAIRTGKKVNGFTLAQLEDMVSKFKVLAA
jgi:hypothetical protein